jgi:hypothetical protein
MTSKPILEVPHRVFNKATDRVTDFSPSTMCLFGELIALSFDTHIHRACCLRPDAGAHALFEEPLCSFLDSL